MRRLRVLISLFSAILIVASCSKEDDSNPFYDDYDFSSDTLNLVDDTIALKKAISVSASSCNRGVSIGVFGGSLSSLPESKYAKFIWAKYLNAKIYTYGIGGYGFSINRGSIQKQVDTALSHDIYILWASTNDYTGNELIGDCHDYTTVDNFDVGKLNTQCGGMNYYIKQLRQKNPQAKIYIFCSLPFFIYPGGYQKQSNDVNDIYKSFYEYVDAQIQVAQYNGLKYLNQFEFSFLTLEKSTEYYKEDKFHMTEKGYANVGVYQLYFLATEKSL